jgi:hypothetical protein
MFFHQQNQRIRGWNRFFPEAEVERVEEVAQIMYTKVSKCKNDKIKLKKNHLIRMSCPQNKFEIR